LKDESCLFAKQSSTELPKTTETVERELEMIADDFLIKRAIKGENEEGCDASCGELLGRALEGFSGVWWW
jgi:hypothetical protein